MPPHRELFLKSSLSWLGSHVHLFWPPGDARPKRLSELLILSSRLAETEPHGDVGREWLRAAGRVLDDGEDYWHARAAPSRSLYFLAPYLLLRRSGFRSAEYESTMEELVEQTPWESTEVLPYQRLQDAWLLWHSGVGGSEPDWAMLYRSTGLSRMTNPLHVGKWDVYYATHTLFYLSDFGRRPPAVDDLSRIGDFLSLWLIRYVREQHWDLVGELLTCLDLIGPPTDLASLVAPVFMSTQAPDGSIVPDREARDCLRDAPDTDDTKIRFNHCYHSTLVGSLWASG